jgi:hypothetical protein
MSDDKKTEGSGKMLLKNLLKNLLILLKVKVK